ncbi:MAG TPA: hypothetical protein VHL11_17940 [Phototrophicaceae bacterium]|jgi:hypothetical protein|nr:hypothetical protein [Phototrophicaceae bacterium]
MQNAAIRSSLIRQIIQAQYEIDAHLPRWARRSHPIVRRHLGAYWRVMTPQIEPVAQWYLMQSLLVFMTYPLPFLLTAILPMVIVSGALLPAGIVYFTRSIYNIASDSTRTMVNEVENATLPLLLATPYPVREILLCKIAGAMWRQSEMLVVLSGIAVYTQMPTLVLIYLNRFPPEEFGMVAQLFTVVVFAASIIRLPLEMFMAASVGHYIGVTTTGRSAAVVSTMTILIFYFVLVNLPRLITMSVLGQLFVDAALPLILPLMMIAGFMLMTERELANKL